MPTRKLCLNAFCTIHYKVWMLLYYNCIISYTLIPENVIFCLHLIQKGDKLYFAGKSEMTNFSIKTYPRAHKDTAGLSR